MDRPLAQQPKSSVVAGGLIVGGFFALSSALFLWLDTGLTFGHALAVGIGAVLLIGLVSYGTTLLPARMRNPPPLIKALVWCWMASRCFHYILSWKNSPLGWFLLASAAGGAFFAVVVRSPKRDSPASIFKLEP